MPSKIYSNEDYTFILKTLSQAVGDTLDVAYKKGDNFNAYEDLNLRLNNAVANKNTHSKKLIAELMVALEAAIEELSIKSFITDTEADIEAFMGVIKEAVATLIEGLEVVKNSITTTNHNDTIHVLQTLFSYAETSWLITITDQDSNPRYESLHQLTLDGEDIYELSEDDYLVLSLLIAITTFMGVEKEAEIMNSVAIRNPEILKKAEKMQRIFGGEVNDHLHVALIFYSLTDGAVVDDNERNVAAYLKARANHCTAEQALDQAFIVDNFGLTRKQAKIVSKLFSKRKKFWNFF